jgi:hypothetical protein
MLERGLMLSDEILGIHNASEANLTSRYIITERVAFGSLTITGTILNLFSRLRLRPNFTPGRFAAFTPGAG